MIDYKVHKIFPVPLFQFKIKNYKELNLELESYILNLKKKDKIGQKKSNAGGWHSPFFNLEDKAPKKFLQNIGEFLEKIIVNEMGWEYYPEKVKVLVMWSIINKKGSFNIQHNHPNSYLSGSYYVKFSKNSGKINFFDPKEQKNIRYPHTKKYTELSAAVTSIEPEEGNLLLFPSYLYHSVDENKSDDERIVISFNIDIIN